MGSAFVQEDLDRVVVRIFEEDHMMQQVSQHATESHESSVAISGFCVGHEVGHVVTASFSPPTTDETRQRPPLRRQLKVIDCSVRNSAMLSSPDRGYAFE